MLIIKDGAIVEDRFRHVGSDGDLPAADIPVIVPLARWLAERDGLRGRDGGLGVRLEPDDDPELIRDDLQDLKAVAVDFPSFMDGRGYSIARILRKRFGYRGELRAVGDVMRDQIFYLQRCGFTAYETKDGKNIEDVIQGLKDFSVTYQVSVDQKLPLYRRR